MICRKCNKEKAREEFTKKMSGTLGKRCRDCRTTYKTENNKKHAKTRADKQKERYRKATACPLSKAWLNNKRRKYRKTPNGAASHLASTRARQAGLGKATPTWVDRKTLNQIYRCRPDGFHVDHVIPLNGSDVCGLHVPWNLQYLSSEENLKKGNKV